jgi:predicted MFS family arabinose efflux permease
MKIAADYYDRGLGKSLGFLVGALVLGTAFPHFLKDLTQNISWRFVIIATSCLAIIGGLLMLLFVPKGPFCKPSQKVEISAFVKVFKNKDFRSAAFGYFGHMWELYAFWAFVPIILNTYNSIFPTVELNVSLWSFIIIGIGGISCVLSGYLSQKHGTKTIAFVALLLSCICCLLSPLAFTLNNSHVFIAFLIFWGMVVIADSPLFSTMVAQNAPSENKGTALTIVNCIGFTITIVSIQLITLYSEIVGDTFIYMILAIGPIIGLIKLRQNNTKLT